MKQHLMMALAAGLWVGRVTALTLTVEADRTLTADERAALNDGGETELVVSGAGVLTMEDLDSFAGTITVKAGGAIRIRAATGLGRSGAATVIEDGATLIVDTPNANDVSLSGRTVTIAGTGRDGAGAVVVTGQGQNFLFDKLVLADDATIGGDKSWGSVRAHSTLDMGGHELTVAASAYWRFTDVENPGDIILRSWLDVRDNGTFPESEDVHEIRVMATGVLSLYGWPKPCPWRIRFAEPTSGSFSIHPGDGTSEALNVLAGPVVIDEGVTVKFNYQKNPAWQMTFAGKVSGAGNIELKMPGTVRFLSGDNDFTGAVTVSNGGVLYAGADGALPLVNDVVTLPSLSSTARLRLRCRTAGSPDGWTLAHVNQYLSSAIGSLCVLDVPDGETFDLDAPAAAVGDLRATGGDIAFTGSDDARTPTVFGSLALRQGTLTLRGGLFSFRDADGKASDVSVGSDVGVSPVARLSFAPDARGVLQGGAQDAQALRVGCTPGRVGVVEIADGACVTNGFVCGAVSASEASQMTDGKVAAGVVRQRGGSVVACGKASVTLSDNRGYGSYELLRGSLETSYPFGIGGRGGLGIFRQDGGTCRVGGYSISLGQGGTGVVYQAGGTLVCTTLDIQLGETRFTGFQDTFASFANWTIAGTAQTETRNFWGGRHSNLASYLNLIDGGTLYANNVHKGETANLPNGSYVTELYNNDFFVNFNGGVFRRRLQDDLFDPEYLPTRVTVYPKGAVFRVDRAADVANVHAPLLAPGAGNGVTNIPCPARTDYLGAPFVEIVGDGQGATAVALLDADTGAVTNVVVTSPGWGYTEATAVFTGGGCTEVETIACALGDVSGGGLVKRGAGTLKLMAANAWTGATTVEEGTLVQGVADAIPVGTALVLQSGATLDLNGFAASFAGVGGAGGKVVGGDLVLSGTFALSARKFIDRETTAIDGTLDLTGVTRLVLTETDVLTEAALRLRPLSLVSATAIRYPSPRFEIAGVPDGWCLVCTPTAIRLKRARGLAVIIR